MSVRAVVLVVAVALLGWFGFRYVADRVKTSDCSGGTIGLNVAAAPDIAPVLAQVAGSLSGPERHAGSYCYTVRVAAADPARMAATLAGRSGDTQPDVWVPDSSYWLGRARAVALDAGRLSRSCLLMRLHMAARLEFVLSIGYDDFVWRDSAGNLNQISLRDRDIHIPGINCFILFHYVNVITLWPALYRGRRKHRCVLAGLKQQVNVNELVRPQLIIFVIKNSFQSTGACGLVNLIVDGKQLAGGQFCLIIPAVGIHP